MSIFHRYKRNTMSAFHDVCYFRILTSYRMYVNMYNIFHVKLDILPYCVYILCASLRRIMSVIFKELHPIFLHYSACLMHQNSVTIKISYFCRLKLFSVRVRVRHFAAGFFLKKKFWEKKILRNEKLFCEFYKKKSILY